MLENMDWREIIKSIPFELQRMFRNHEDKLTFENKYQLAIALPFAENNQMFMNATLYSLRIAHGMKGLDKLLLYRRACKNAEHLKNFGSLYTVAYGYIVEYLEKDGLIKTIIYNNSKKRLNNSLYGG